MSKNNVNSKTNTPRLSNLESIGKAHSGDQYNTGKTPKNQILQITPKTFDRNPLKGSTALSEAYQGDKSRGQRDMEGSRSPSAFKPGEIVQQPRQQRDSLQSRVGLLTTQLSS